MERLVCLAAIALLAASRSDAAYTMTFNQVGTNVVATGSGTLTLVGDSPSIVAQKGIQPAKALAIIGTISDYPAVYRVNFLTAEGFGTANGGSLAALGSGDPVGLSATLGQLFVPVGYMSGAALSSSSTFTGQTFASLGLTLGTYSYAYSAPTGGPALDSIIIQVNPAVVPEPSSLLLGSVAGLVGLGVARIRRRSV